MRIAGWNSFFLPVYATIWCLLFLMASSAFFVDVYAVRAMCPRPLPISKGWHGGKKVGGKGGAAKGALCTKRRNGTVRPEKARQSLNKHSAQRPENPSCSKTRRQGTKKRVHKAVSWAGQVLVDAFDLNYQLLSVDSAKIITATIPFYLTTRRFDDRVQCCFYDPVNHLNIRQLPSSCHTIAQTGVGIPMVGLSALSLVGWNEDIRLTGRMTAIGLPFVHWGKVCIKQWRSTGCLRPWNEYFSRYQRSCGGFPSGHLANVTFMATLWGMRHGPAWAVPLSLFGLFVMADFINCNRHYPSQLIAGACLGVLYAWAANKVVEKKLSNSMTAGLGITRSGLPAVQYSYTF